MRSRSCSSRSSVRRSSLTSWRVLRMSSPSVRVACAMVFHSFGLVVSVRSLYCPTVRWLCWRLSAISRTCRRASRGASRGIAPPRVARYAVAVDRSYVIFKPPFR
eukprot:10652493-Alexandrium_andersonii.AAC.1